MGLGAHGNGAAAGLVALTDAIGAHDDGAGWEIGTGYDLHELVDGRIRIIDEIAGCLDCLGKVVRSDVRRHTDGDALATINQQVGETRRQSHGLREGLVVVGLPVDSILL